MIKVTFLLKDQTISLDIDTSLEEFLEFHLKSGDNPDGNIIATDKGIKRATFIPHSYFNDNIWYVQETK